MPRSPKRVRFSGPALGQRSFGRTLSNRPLQAVVLVDLVTQDSTRKFRLAAWDATKKLTANLNIDVQVPFYLLPSRLRLSNLPRCSC